jgi:transposase
VINAVEGGASFRQAAARYGVSASVAVKWAHRFRQTGSIAAKPMGGDRRSRLKSERDWLLKRMAAQPDLTPAELHKELRARGIQVGYLTVRRFVRKEKIDSR